MSDDAIANCCGACFAIYCLTCCESILVALNFRKPGSRAGSTQRGCCRNLGESTEDDVFEENARRQRVADSPKELPNGSGESKEEGGGDRAVAEQPAASPAMTTVASTTAVKPDSDEVK